MRHVILTAAKPTTITTATIGERIPPKPVKTPVEETVVRSREVVTIVTASITATENLCAKNEPFMTWPSEYSSSDPTRNRQTPRAWGLSVAENRKVTWLRPDATCSRTTHDVLTVGAGGRIHGSGEPVAVPFK